MKCDVCLFKSQCSLNPEDCAILAIEDDPTVGQEMPHPTEISFRLANVSAQFIGNQLILFVDENTLKAIAAMRMIDFAGTGGSDIPLMGFMDEAGICFIST